MARRMSYQEIRETSTRNFIKGVLGREKEGKDAVSPMAVKLDECLAWVDRVIDPEEEQARADSTDQEPDPPGVITQTGPPSDTGIAVPLPGMPHPQPGEDWRIGDIVGGRRKPGTNPKPPKIKKAHHEPKVLRTEQEEDLILEAYLATDDSGRPKYSTTWIKEHFNISPGELYRLLQRRKTNPKRWLGQKAKAVREAEEILTNNPKEGFLEPTSDSQRYWFEKWRRKRWVNIGQREDWEECEKFVGPVNMMAAAKWAVDTPTPKIKAVFTRARQIKKEFGYR